MNVILYKHKEKPGKLIFVFKDYPNQLLKAETRIQHREFIIYKK